MVRKRLKAFAIDYLIILSYAGLLFAATLLLSNAFSLRLESLAPLWRQLLGFATLTLPVILYFTVSEYGPHAATVGKRSQKVRVAANGFTKAGFAQLLLRNSIKSLPWELAHFFVFRLLSFTNRNAQPPDWVLAGLIAAQVLAVIYLLCLLFNKENRSIYEGLSSTRVIQESAG